MSTWDQLADKATVERTVAALEGHGITVHVVDSGAAAKAKLLEILPPGAEVMTMTSVTLDTIGASQEINESQRYQSVRAKLSAMDSKTQGQLKRQLGAAPEWAVGSVHAVTEDGHVLIASNTGSQQPAYAYGARQVVWVAGTQKIVRDVAAGHRRIFEHCLPLEEARAQQAYGVASGVSKILEVYRETVAGRITIILVNQVLGF